MAWVRSLGVDSLILSGLGLAGLLAAPSLAIAAQDEPRPERAEASRLFNLGRIAFRAERYEEAILRWQESYALSKEPLILYNIGLAFEKLGDHRRALEHMREWREHAPPEEHDKLDARIETLERRARLDAANDDDEESDEAAQAPAQPAEPDRAGAPAGLPPTTVAGFSLIGIGGAAVIAGVVVDIVAAVERPSEEEACIVSGSEQFCRHELRDDIERANTLAIAGDATWIGGAVIAGVGLALVIATGFGDGEDRDVAFSPLLSLDAVGMSATVRF